MKKKFLQFAGVLLLGSAMVFTSCTKDDDTDPTATSPNISFGSAAGFVDSDTMVEQGTTFKVKIIASKGSGSLQEFTVFKDNVALAFSEITIDGVAATANPVTIGAFDANSLSWDVEIKAVDHVATHEYRFQVQGADGPTSSVKVNITTFPNLTGIVFNADGPNQGGFDFSAGTTVGSLNASADVRDLGIDLGLPIAQNWMRQIEPANGAVLRKAAGGTTWASIDTKAKVQTAFDAAGANLAVSPIIVAGDLYLVKKDAEYYLVRFREVNVTVADNLDNYVIDVK